MLQKYLNKIWQSESLKKKITITLALVVLFEFLSIIPVPGVNLEALVLFQKKLEMQQ